MIRKTINNEGEWTEYETQCISDGYTWRGVAPNPESVPYPVQIITRPEDNMYMTWSTQLLSDIAETISNEAVYLQALEHVYDEICRISRAVKERGVDHVQARNMQDESLSHIRSICATAIQSCYTGTGEVDRTQEYEEDKLSNA